METNNNCTWFTSHSSILLRWFPSFLQAEWEKLFSEASLHLVAVRKSFYGSALFLCQCQSVVKQPLFLPIDSTNYEWVETLKVLFTLFSFQNDIYSFYKIEQSRILLCHFNVQFHCDFFETPSYNSGVLCWYVPQGMMAESSDCPLWLTASQAHCGIVGMVNCLRQEPGGNRLR